MDYWGVVRQAWSCTVRERGLWGLGAVSAAYAAIAGLFSGVVVLVTFAALGISQVLADPSLAEEPISPELLDIIGRELSSGRVVTIVGAVLSVAFAMLVVVGIAEVAALGGLVVESDAALGGARSSTRRGFEAGLSRWWRIAGVYAIAAVPSLAMLGVYALMLAAAVLVPVMSGDMPDPLGLNLAMQGVSPLISLLGLLAWPVGVWTALAMRYALLHDLEWRAALAAAWRLLKSRFFDVMLLALTVAATVWVVGFAASMLLGTLFGIAVFAGVVAVASDAPLLWAVTAVGVLAGALVLFIQTVGVVVFTQTAYTTAWRQWVAVPSAEQTAHSPAPAYSEGR